MNIINQRNIVINISNFMHEHKFVGIIHGDYPRTYLRG